MIHHRNHDVIQIILLDLWVFTHILLFTLMDSSLAIFLWLYLSLSLLPLSISSTIDKVKISTYSVFYLHFDLLGWGSKGMLHSFSLKINTILSVTYSSKPRLLSLFRFLLLVLHPWWYPPTFLSFNLSSSRYTRST